MTMHTRALRYNIPPCCRGSTVLWGGLNNRWIPLRYGVHSADLLASISSISIPLYSSFIVHVKVVNLVISRLDHKQSYNGFNKPHEALGEKVGMSD